MGAEKSIRDMTDEEVYIQQAVRNVDSVARGLERLAERLRKLAERYVNSGETLGGAVNVAAEVVNQFTQSVGNQGSHLWDAIRAAQDLDDHRRASELRGEV